MASDLDIWDSQPSADDGATMATPHLAFLDNLVSSLNERPNEGELILEERKRHETKLRDVITQMLFQGGVLQQKSADGSGLTCTERLDRLIDVHDKLTKHINNAVLKPLSKIVEAASVREHLLDKIPTQRSIRRSILKKAVQQMVVQMAREAQGGSFWQKPPKEELPILTLAELTRYSKLRRIMDAFVDMVEMEREIRDQIIPSDESQGQSADNSTMEGYVSCMERETNAIKIAWYRQLEASDMNDPEGESKLISTVDFEDEIDHLSAFIESMTIYLEGCMTAVPKQDVMQVAQASSIFAAPPGMGAAKTALSKRSSQDLYSIKRIDSILRNLPRKYTPAHRVRSFRQSSEIMPE